jgi:2,4'-dihydroxyacetophenone dioxygenase
VNKPMPPIISSIVPPAAREAIHIGIGDTPFVPQGETAMVQFLHVDLMQNLVVVRSRFKPGHTEPTHYHAGAVFAVTEQGSWHYAEYPEEVNRPGSYLFEPPGSVHTLVVPKDQEQDTVAWFAVYGSLAYLDAQGQVVRMSDAKTGLDHYRQRCVAAGLSWDKLIVVGE